ncbi:hypothetical protein C2E23DRAFT_293417 [Lenzites betulinus]|nr:hypothetical protein C2E23DRAFT_293417 [Lenzites betulinus]
MVGAGPALRGLSFPPCLLAMIVARCEDVGAYLHTGCGAKTSREENALGKSGSSQARTDGPGRHQCLHHPSALDAWRGLCCPKRTESRDGQSAARAKASGRGNRGKCSSPDGACQAGVGRPWERVWRRERPLGNILQDLPREKVFQRVTRPAPGAQEPKKSLSVPAGIADPAAGNHADLCATTEEWGWCGGRCVRR